jgi:hypothetical protein
LVFLARELANKVLSESFSVWMTVMKNGLMTVPMRVYHLIRFLPHVPRLLLVASYFFTPFAGYRAKRPN